MITRRRTPLPPMKHCPIAPTVRVLTLPGMSCPPSHTADGEIGEWTALVLRAGRYGKCEVDEAVFELGAEIQNGDEFWYGGYTVRRQDQWCKRYASMSPNRGTPPPRVFIVALPCNFELSDTRVTRCLKQSFVVAENLAESCIAL